MCFSNHKKKKNAVALKEDNPPGEICPECPLRSYSKTGDIARKLQAILLCDASGRIQRGIQINRTLRNSDHVREKIQINLSPAQPVQPHHQRAILWEPVGENVSLSF